MQRVERTRAISTPKPSQQELKNITKINITDSKQFPSLSKTRENITDNTLNLWTRRSIENAEASRSYQQTDLLQPQGENIKNNMRQVNELGMLASEVKKLNTFMNVNKMLTAVKILNSKLAMYHSQMEKFEVFVQFYQILDS